MPPAMTAITATATTRCRSPSGSAGSSFAPSGIGRVMDPRHNPHVQKFCDAPLK